MFIFLFLQFISTKMYLIRKNKTMNSSQQVILRQIHCFLLTERRKSDTEDRNSILERAGGDHTALVAAHLPILENWVACCRNSVAGVPPSVQVASGTFLSS
jgi:hypothetical protein